MSRNQQHTHRDDIGPWDIIYAELQSQSERTVAILGGAMLEYSISKLLVLFLVDDPKEVANLFAPSNPISAVGSKVRLSYCLGLISRRRKEDSLAIAHIRNFFAHNLHDCSFEHQALAKDLDKLRPYQRFINPPPAITNRTLFQTALGILIYNLAVQTTKFEFERRQALLPRSMEEILREIRSVSVPADLR